MILDLIELQKPESVSAGNALQLHLKQSLVFLDLVSLVLLDYYSQMSSDAVTLNIIIHLVIL